MVTYIVRRVLQSVVLIFATSVIVFFGVTLIGDPVANLAGPQCFAECRKEVVRQLGLDLPIAEQYLHFLVRVSQGDLGKSFAYGEPAARMIIERLPASLELALCAIVLAVTLGIPLGVWAGLQPKAVSSRLIMSFSILGFSTPVFWQAIIMIMVFSVWLGILPATGRGQTALVFGIPLSIVTWDGLAHIVLPAINLSLVPMALALSLIHI